MEQEIKNYNDLYDFIEDNSHIISTTTLTLAGSVTFGLTGALAGCYASGYLALNQLFYPMLNASF